MEERRNRVRKVRRKRRKKGGAAPEPKSPNLPSLSPKMPAQSEPLPGASPNIVVPEIMPTQLPLFPPSLFQQLDAFPLPVQQAPQQPLPPGPQLEGIPDLLAHMSHLADKLGPEGGSAEVSMRWENGQMIQTDMKVEHGRAGLPFPKITAVGGPSIPIAKKKKANDDIWAIVLGAAAGLFAFGIMDSTKRKSKPNKNSSSP